MKLDKYGNEVWRTLIMIRIMHRSPITADLRKSLAMDEQNKIYVMTELLRPDNSGLMDGPMGVIIESNGLVRLNNYYGEPATGLVELFAYGI